MSATEYAGDLRAARFVSVGLWARVDSGFRRNDAVGALDDLTVEVVGIGAIDPRCDDLADTDGQTTGEMHAAVDFGCIPHCAALGSAPTRFVDDDGDAEADLAAEVRGADRLLGLHQAVPARV